VGGFGGFGGDFNGKTACAIEGRHRGEPQWGICLGDDKKFAKSVKTKKEWRGGEEFGRENGGRHTKQ